MGSFTISRLGFLLGRVLFLVPQCRFGVMFTVFYVAAIEKANPESSMIHINGCRGSGKTTLLHHHHLLGKPASSCWSLVGEILFSFSRAQRI
jgi:predicted AAA+ superfamily ATPase